MDQMFGLKEMLKIYYQKDIQMNIHQMVSSVKKQILMDVWFDSGSSHTGAMMERGLDYPADLVF